MLLCAWVQASVAHTRASRLAVLQRLAHAARHPAHNARGTLASWEMNPGRRALAAYERCRRKLAHQLAWSATKIFVTSEQERAIDMLRNVDLVIMYENDIARVIADLPFLNGAAGIVESEITDTLIFVAHRRFGKSFLASVDCVCGMLTMHGNVTQTNMNTVQATIWLEQTMEFMLLLAADDEFGFTVNRYTSGVSLSILGRYPTPSKRVCEVMGGGGNHHAAQGNRGHGNAARKVYQDELLLCSPAAIEVRMPMLLRGAGCVGISSAPPTNATANKLLTAVYPDGMRIAHVFTQRNVCSMCADEERRLKCAINCKHGVPNTNNVTSHRHRERVKGLLAGAPPSLSLALCVCMDRVVHSCQKTCP